MVVGYSLIGTAYRSHFYWFSSCYMRAILAMVSAILLQYLLAKVTKPATEGTYLKLHIHMDVMILQVLFVCLFLWRDSLQWAMASSFTMFLDHTQRRTIVGRSPLDE